MTRRSLLALGLLLFATASVSFSAEKPKVRCITAFVRLDRTQYQTQVRDALVTLRAAKAAFEKGGYEVETIRISTQPFPEIISGLDDAEAIAFFKVYDKLAEKEGFDAAIGPAMLSDADDQRKVELLGEIIRSTNILNGSIVVGGEDGVYWNAVRSAAALMKTLSEKTPHSQGNFRFSATAMLPTDTPFYPGSYHMGAGRQFAVGL